MLLLFYSVCFDYRCALDAVLRNTAEGGGSLDDWLEVVEQELAALEGDA